MRPSPPVLGILSVLALGASACSTLYDFDALDGCGRPAPKEKLSTTPCHSVYVAPDESFAIVTHYKNESMGGGVYRIDLRAKDPGSAESRILAISNGAGIASDGTYVV